MALLLPLFALVVGLESRPPAVGETAPAFNVRTLDHKSVRLVPLLKQGPVVLVMLRGFPGYQCPICTRQVAELFSRSDEFAKQKATVVLVYPGPSAELEKRAGEFVEGKTIPKSFRFTIDPDFAFTKVYGLRWDAEGETAYPSTFVIGRDGRVAYAKVSHTHGDRAPIGDVLDALSSLATAPR